MLAGELYIADDPELEQASRRAYRLMKEYEARYAVDRNEAMVVLKELLGEVGPGSTSNHRYMWITAPTSRWEPGHL